MEILEQITLVCAMISMIVLMPVAIFFVTYTIIQMVRGKI